MRKKLISYVNDLFAQAPKNPQARDLHDEILLNTLDRFDEEVAAGQPEQAAFDAAVAGIGDIDELLEPLGANKPDVIFRRVIAIALYVCCVIPVILTEAFGGVAETVGVCLMFVLAALATYLLLSANVTAKTKKRKRLRALGIALYVVCVTPTILFDGLLGGKAGEAVGVSLMFLIAAAATGLVVYSANRTGKKTPARTAAVQKETEEKTTEQVIDTPPTGNGVRVEDLVTIEMLNDKLSALIAKFDAVVKENSDLKDALDKKGDELSKMQDKYENRDFGGSQKRGMDSDSKYANDTFEEYAKQFM